MDLWIGLVAGLIAGWLVEWVIDRVYLRREHQTLLATYNRLHAEALKLRVDLSGDQERQARLMQLEQAEGGLQSRLEREAERRTTAEQQAAALQSRLDSLEKEMGQLRERLYEQRQMEARLAELEAELARQRGETS